MRMIKWMMLVLICVEGINIQAQSKSSAKDVAHAMEIFNTECSLTQVQSDSLEVELIKRHQELSALYEASFVKVEEKERVVEIRRRYWKAIVGIIGQDNMVAVKAYWDSQIGMTDLDEFVYVIE